MEEEKIEGELIGEVTDFFAKVSAAAIKLSGPLKAGDKIRIKGHTTDLELVVESMQIGNVSVSEAKAGDDIGVLVKDRVRKRDKVYKV